MITGNETQNIKKMIDNVKSYSTETKGKNNNIIEKLKMIEESNPSSVDNILKDQITKISSLEMQYGNILKLLNNIESTVNDLVNRINKQEELDQQIIKCKQAGNKTIFEALKDFTKKNIVGSTANNDQSKMQPIQVLTNAFTEHVKIESQKDLSDLRDILISVINSLKDVKNNTLAYSKDYNKFICAVDDKVKSYIFKDIKENDSIDNLVNGFSENIKLFNNMIISSIIKTCPENKTSISMLGKICNGVFDELYNRLQKYKWNDKSIKNYKQLAEKYIDNLNDIPEQIRNNIKWFAKDFGVQALLRNIKNEELLKKYTKEGLRKKDISRKVQLPKVQLPHIFDGNNINLNKQNNQANRLNINNVNLGLNNNNLPFKNKNHKGYLELLELEKRKELYKNNKGNINNNQSGKGTSIANKKFKLKK